MKCLLIANRGEIAVRILKTCQKLGIRTAVTYSEADADALHVRLADKAYCIGPKEAAASYLNIDAILKAAKRANADAIHPGYGFLAESPALAQACAEANIGFVGPKADVIQKMGSKVEAKKIAEEAGVPVVPGHYGTQDGATLLKAAKRIGFPVFIKASAGGGGKGMRLVEDEKTFLETLSLARQEAKSAFGDETVLLEKAILNPRHIEVQVAGDKHGNVVHLFERECSIQRRHQKIIEEAPAGFLDEKMRAALFDYAIRITKAIGYDSLGTIEFLYDEDTGEAYFLEMNTRLQVEHPVTELITGLDLVALQIGIATGDAIPFKQSDLAVSGWAIEARINAEAPADNFRPEIGPVLLYDEPQGDGVRVDSGVAAGSEVMPWYDPMLAKVIAHGKDREEARQRLIAALANYTLAGVTTNIAFLGDVLAHPNFSERPLTTRFLIESFPDGWKEAPAEADATLAGIAYVLHVETGANAASPWQSLGPWRVMDQNVSPGVTHLRLQRQDAAEDVKIAGHDGNYCVTRGEQSVDVRAKRLPDNRICLWMDGERHEFRAVITEDQIVIAGDGHNTVFTLESHLAAEQSASAPQTTHHTLYAPMPGLITALSATKGDRVKTGDVLVVMEAMKLVHNLVAETDGIVEAIHCKQGATVAHKAPLVEIGPEEETTE
ncbi:ATP-grasp domain-containing protein [Rhodospirillaceae bacterium AH-315-P19]|nr:ATP-grasp domain-containing protein [Rhodospirillaceae bacterium AH-315-P19]